MGAANLENLAVRKTLLNSLLQGVVWIKTADTDGGSGFGYGEQELVDDELVVVMIERFGVVAMPPYSFAWSRRRWWGREPSSRL
ncbi:unnamed protein product [Linum trigynum]|uniref:Uncharacterized protein n=1 Tax=Linum trigynum TaxID=586398 RepID=A0AAV2FEI7_9ROSI